MKPLLLALLVCALAPLGAQACPGCIEGVTVCAGAGQSLNVLAGFSLSVLALLAAVGGVGFVLWRVVLKAVRESDARWDRIGDHPAS